MKIYEIYPFMDMYSSLESKTNPEGEKFEKFYLEELSVGWIPAKVKLLKSHKEGDFYGILGGTILGVNRTGYDVLSNYEMGHIEFLPIKMKVEKELFALNVLNHISILDEEKSEIIRFSDNRIMMITNYVFQSNLKSVPVLFKLSNYKKGTLFATDKFKQIVEENKLTGFQFEEIWSE